MIKLVKRSETQKDEHGKSYVLAEYALNKANLYYSQALNLEAILRSNGIKPKTKTRRKVKTEIFTLPAESWVVPWIKNIERDYNCPRRFIR